MPFRQGLRKLLEAEPGVEVAGEAEDGGQAVELAQRRRPDVVLMDVRMPRVDGIEATRRILELPAAPRVLVLTTFAHEQYVYEALQAGASGFLLKDAPLDKLLEGIELVARGEALLSPQITRAVIARATSCSIYVCPTARRRSSSHTRPGSCGRARPTSR